VALGDSYSSGVGTRNYDYTADCQRSTKSYPYIMFHRLIASQGATAFQFFACGGATTEDIDEQLMFVPDEPTKWVTISIGGNDAGFIDVVRQCAKFWPATCWGDINKAERFIREELPGRLDNAYSQIKARASHARVAVLGYPRVFKVQEGGNCNGASRISEEEAQRLNDATDVLRDTIRERLRCF